MHSNLKGWCKVCALPNVEAVNRALVRQEEDGKSIAGWAGVNPTTLYKHARRCLEMGLQRAINQRSIAQAVSVYDELVQNLEAAKEARGAARAWLDLNGQLDLDFRPDEVLVVYEDHDDVTEQGKPRRKKASLRELLTMVTDLSYGSIKAVSGYAKRADLREYLLKAIDRCDTVIDKFARIHGEYQSERMNQSDVDRVRLNIEAAVSRFGTDFETELKFFIETQAHKLRPDIRAGLVTKLLDSRPAILIGAGEGSTGVQPSSESRSS